MGPIFPDPLLLQADILDESNEGAFSIKVLPLLFLCVGIYPTYSHKNTERWTRLT